MVLKILPTAVFQVLSRSDLAFELHHTHTHTHAGTHAGTRTHAHTLIKKLKKYIGKLYRLKILQRYFYENHSFSAVGRKKTHVTTFSFTFAGNVHLFSFRGYRTRISFYLLLLSESLKGKTEKESFKVVENKAFLQCK